MDFIGAVKQAFRKYLDFSTRATRAEFWYFLIFLIIAGSILTVVEGQIFPQAAQPTAGFSFSMGMDASNGPISAIFSLLTVIPWFSATARRLHDVDKSGWWMLFGFIPIIGWIAMLIWLTKRGGVGANRFGDDPSGQNVEGVFE